MTKALKPTEKSRKQRDTTKTQPNTSITHQLQTDLGTIVDQLGTVSWSNNSYPTGVVKLVYGF